MVVMAVGWLLLLGRELLSLLLFGILSFYAFFGVFLLFLVAKCGLQLLASGETLSSPSGST